MFELYCTQIIQQISKKNWNVSTRINFKLFQGVTDVCSNFQFIPGTNNIRITEAETHSEEIRYLE